MSLRFVIGLMFLGAASFPTLGCSSFSQWSERMTPAKKFKVQKRWVRNTFMSPYYGFRLNQQMQPMVTNNLVIQGNSLDGISAFDRKSGNVRWQLKLNGGVEAGAQLVKGNLYFGANDGQFYSVNAETGLINWTFPIRSEGLGAPTVSEGKVYFLAGNNIAYALDASTGKQLWLYNRRDTSNISVRGGSQPAVSDDAVYIGFSDGYIVALNRKNGGVLWDRPLNRNRRFRDVDSSPQIDGEFLYVSSFDDGVYCLRRDNGQLVWRADGGGASAVTLTPRRLFYSSSNGDVVALDKRSGKELWKISLKSGVATRPMVYQGLLGFGESDGAFQVVNASDGQPVGQFDTGRGVQAEPQIDASSGEVYLMSINANLYALQMAWQSPLEAWPWDK